VATVVDATLARHDVVSRPEKIMPRSWLAIRGRVNGENMLARPLPWLLLLGVALRLWAALTPGFHHPDAIYQYLEPAHRLLTGEGVVTWEWRDGIRSWLIPTLLAVPLGLGEALDPNGPLPMILPRLATGIASLGIIWAGWDIGRRHSPTTGILTGLVAATWFECVFFAAETLAEPLAVAAIIPAAALVTSPRRTRTRLVLAGALLGFAALARPHYGPAAAVLVLVSWWPSMTRARVDLRPWIALLGGAVAVAAISASIDAGHGLTPFAWIIENVRQNVVHNVSARYGVFPPLTYVAWFVELWSWWLIPATVGVLYGWRLAPGLFAAAVVTVIVHSLIPHKEYRFVYLSFAILALLAAMGWGVLIAAVRQRHGTTIARIATIAVVLMWSVASITLARGYLAPTSLEPHADGARIFATLRRDPAVCGVALVHPASFADVPGAVALRRGTPVSMFWADDPASGRGGPWAAAARQAPDFNRIVTASAGPITVPAGYHVSHCERRGSARMCILSRPGPCRSSGRSPFLINRAMARMGF